MIDYTLSTLLLTPLTVLHLRFRVRALDPIRFGEQPGSAIRGALYGVLRDNFCSAAQGFGGPDHALHCPVCWLLALEDGGSGRGKDLPRPLMVEPPLSGSTFAIDQEFSFGISLVGQAQKFLPFVVRAVEQMGKVGVGERRGRFQLCEMREYDPLLDVERSLLDGRTLRTPKLVISTPLITAAAENLAGDQVQLHFLTPTRLIDDGHLCKTAEPVVVIKRLIERCQSLTLGYGLWTDSVAGGEAQTTPQSRVSNKGVPSPLYLAWEETYKTLSEHAQTLTLAENLTQWVEVHSGSRRQQRTTPISGFVGSVRWHGDVRPLLPWLLWGQSVHVGKDAVKGNGWFRVGA